VVTFERTAEILAEILHELDQPHGPTECQDVTVLDSWTIGDQIFVIYTAPWFDGVLGYRQHLDGWDESELVEDIAHFTIAEPLGRVSLVLDPPDSDGVTWWEPDTLHRLKGLKIPTDPDVPGSGRL
jgi:hypothetical protein